MIVDLAVYTHGKREPGSFSIREAAAAGRRPDSFVWLGLYEPTYEEFDEARDEFGLHELAVEDAVRAHQRPKVEIFGDSLFVVLRTARYVDDTETVEFGEIQMFLGDGFIVSVRHSEASQLGVVRAKAEADPDLLAHGPSAVLYSIVDHVVDDYAPVIAGIDHDLREVEAEVFTHERTNPAERIFKLKREVLELSRNTEPLQDALEMLCTCPTGLIDPFFYEYFRDVEDHLLRSGTRIDALGALLSDALSANLAHVSVRQNDDMRTISAWIAIAAIPTLIAGLYGMNFSNMPFLESPFAFPITVVLMVGLCGFCYWRFRQAGWLGPNDPSGKRRVKQ